MPTIAEILVSCFLQKNDLGRVNSRVQSFLSDTVGATPSITKWRTSQGRLVVSQDSLQRVHTADDAKTFENNASSMKDDSSSSTSIHTAVSRKSSDAEELGMENCRYLRLYPPANTEKNVKNAWE